MVEEGGEDSLLEVQEVAEEEVAEDSLQEVAEEVVVEAFLLEVEDVVEEAEEVVVVEEEEEEVWEEEKRLSLNLTDTLESSWPGVRRMLW